MKVMTRWLAGGLTLSSLAVGSALPTEAPLLHERFEVATSGHHLGVVITNDVVGYGGLAQPNRASGLFDGAPQTCILFGPEIRVTSTDFTVEAFVKPTPSGRYAAIAADWSETGPNRSWAFVLTPEQGLRFDISPDGTFSPGNKLASPPRLLKPGQWYHVAAVSEGQHSRLFVNGHEVAALARAQPGILRQETARVRLGNVDGFADNRPKPFSGQLDEVRISLRALTPTEFLRTKESMPKPTGPVPEVYELPFTAKSREGALAWQRDGRARLMALVNAQEPRRSLSEWPLALEVGPPLDRQDYTLFPITFQGNRPGERYAALLTVPKGEGPFPAMLCLHGHGGSAEAVFDSEEVYHGFADRFARGGYVVLAPSFPHRDYAALVLWDLFRCVDLLAVDPRVDSARIGVGGLSMGGEWSMWIAACDPRLKVALISGWMCTTAGIFSVPNCACWELPGFVELMDVCEVNLLIAPRPVVFESAERDGCFPIGHTRSGFARIAAGYEVFGAPGAAVQDVFPGVHEWHGTVSFSVADQVLGGHAQLPKVQ